VQLRRRRRRSWRSSAASGRDAATFGGTGAAALLSGGGRRIGPPGCGPWRHRRLDAELAAGTCPGVRCRGMFDRLSSCRRSRSCAAASHGSVSDRLLGWVGAPDVGTSGLADAFLIEKAAGSAIALVPLDDLEKTVLTAVAIVVVWISLRARIGRSPLTDARNAAHRAGGPFRRNRVNGAALGSVSPRR
jgi:hypothetical protein